MSAEAVFQIHTQRPSLKARFLNLFIRKDKEKLPYHLAFVVDGVKYFQYDEYMAISVARRNQINALIKEEASLNVTRPEAKKIAGSTKEYGESIHALLYAKQLKAVEVYNDKVRGQDVNELRKILRDTATMKNELLMASNIVKIQTEFEKRMEMLTVFKVYARIAALTVWTTGENQEEPLTPDEIEERANLFEKKKVYSALLRLPIADMFYQLNRSKNDSVQYLAMKMREQEVIAEVQRKMWGLSSEKTQATPPEKQ